MKNKNIIVFGCGYVGFSLAVLMSQEYETTIYDVDKQKINSLKNLVSPINEESLQIFFKENSNNIDATHDFDSLTFNEETIVIIAVPTNYDSDNNFFDTSIIESVLSKLNQSNTRISVVIKSTIPIGFTQKVKNIFTNLDIIFIPEFLREGKSIEDNLYPTRIVIGDKSSIGKSFADLFLSISRNDPQVIYMESAEAEAVKLFANSYLATRVTFFNELDSFCYSNNLDSKSVIDGICSDERIGAGYNNPSFGYGGYCLPKDTKQLLANFLDIPQTIFTAVVEGNSKRKKFIADKIIDLKPNKVGIYRLIMKAGSDNYRESSIFDVVKILLKQNIKIQIFEPLINDKFFEGIEIVNDINLFKETSSIIISNRYEDTLADIKSKLFTRDIYGDN